MSAQSDKYVTQLRLYCCCEHMDNSMPCRPCQIADLIEHYAISSESLDGFCAIVIIKDREPGSKGVL